MRVVKIVWHDAQDHADKWVDEEDANTFGGESCEIVSYGILVRQTERYATLAGDWDAADKDYGRLTKIPLGMIISIEDL